jgi:plasmid stabilization system protein ParE
MSGAGDTPRHWAIRFTRHARADVADAWDFLAARASEEVADAWQEGLEEVIAGLSVFPERHPVIEESDEFERTVRRLLYRRSRSGPAYRVLFYLGETAGDAPTVFVMHVRHGARAPLTGEEARQIEADSEE